MEDRLFDKENLNRKIQIMKDLLYEKIDEDIDKEQIQQLSEILDMLIVKYLKAERGKYY